ncbi:MAG: hypothetical protein AAB757_01795 [Patescibacteria group bacterium]
MKRMMATIILVVAIAFTASGCGGFKMVVDAPDRIEVDSVKPGIYRAEVITQFGQPVASGKDDNNNDFDTFAFKTGSSGFGRVTRGLLYGITDLLSLGLMEFLWTPIESGIQAGKTKMKVTYDINGKVIDVKEL